MDNISHESDKNNPKTEKNADDTTGRRYSISPEFADWFERQTGEKLAVTKKYLDSEGKPVYDPSRVVDDRAGVLELARQNRDLSRRLEHWKGQTRLSDSKAKVLKNARTVAASLTDDYYSVLRPADIQADLAELANVLIQGPRQAAPQRQAEESTVTARLRQEYEDGQYRQAWEGELRRRAESIARNIVQNARELAEGQDLNEIKSVREAVRDARISYEEMRSVYPGKGDFVHWFRHNQRRMGLRKDGRSIDTWWQEWQDRFGTNFFPAGITNTTDMLSHVSEMLDTLEPAYENPYSAYMAQAVDACATDILNRVMGDGNWLNSLTAADRQRAREEAAADRLRDIARKSVQRERDKRAEQRERYEKDRRTLQELARQAIRHERELAQQRMTACKENQRRLAEKRKTRHEEAENRKKLKRLREQLEKKKMLRVNKAFRDSILGGLSKVSLNLTGMDIAELAALLREHPEEMDPQSGKYNSEFLRRRVEQILRQRQRTDLSRPRKPTPRRRDSRTRRIPHRRAWTT